MRVLIVDDERIEREGMRYLIDAYFRFETMEAANGKAALRILEQARVDILLTDIKMPLMDGLELIREVHGRFPKMEIIVFSAYGEFEYARQAMQYGVDSYLLKPVDIEEFRRTVERALEKLAERARKENLHAEVRLHHIMQTEQREGRRFTNALLCADRGEAIEYLREGIGVRDTAVPIIIQTRSGLMMKKLVEVDRALCRLTSGARQQSFFEEKRCCSLLELAGGWDDDGFRALVRKLPDLLKQVNDLLGDETYVIYGEIAATPEQLLDRFRRLYMLTDAMFYEWSDYLLGPDRLCPEDERQNAWAMIESLRGASGAACEWLRHSLEALIGLCAKSMALSALELKQVCLDVARRVGQEKGVSEEEVQHLSMQLLSTERVSELSMRMDRFLSMAYSEMEGDLGRSCIREVLRIIERDYASELSVESIAGRVFMTPNYVSSLFKQSMGVGLVRYITQFRLEKAKVLLRSGNMKVHDVARTVGYENTSYFCMLFRKEYGVTPNQFREQEAGA